MLKYAPLGLTIGSPEWLRIVEQDIKEADAFIILLSRLAIEDASFLRRVGMINSHLAARLPQYTPVVLLVIDETLWSTGMGMLYDKIDRDGSLRMVLGMTQAAPMFARDHQGRLAESLRCMLPKPKPRCFVSYSRNDDKIVAHICLTLTENGISVWRDTTSISPAASWDEEIEKNILSCTHFILAYSAASAVSANVADEVSFAREAKKPIVPLLLDETPLGLRIHRSQAIDFRSSVQEGVAVLLKYLQR